MAMPASAAAWMTVLPLAVATSRPSIVIFTGSAMKLTRRNRAPLLPYVLIELVAIFLDEGGGGHGGRVAERADRVAHDVTAHAQDQIQIARFPFAAFDAPENL